MREIAYVCGARDISSPALLLIGITMLGWAPVAEGLMERSKPPEVAVEDFLDDRHVRNAKILKKMKASKDVELDTETFTKTMAEVERGVLIGPFKSKASYRSMTSLSSRGTGYGSSMAMRTSRQSGASMICSRGSTIRRSGHHQHTAQRIQTVLLHKCGA
jgi:hypothetical protein